MRIIEPFENMEPTYAELANALIELGFVDKNSEDAFVYYNRRHDLKIILPLKKMHERLDAGRFGGVSSQLEHFEIINHMDDLGKMIKAKRLATQKAAA